MAGWTDENLSSGSEDEPPFPPRSPVPVERRGRTAKICTICSSRGFGSSADLERHFHNIHHVHPVPTRCPVRETGRQRMRKGVHKAPPTRFRKVEDWYESMPLRPRKTSACGGGGGGSFRPPSPAVSNASADTDELMERDDEAVRLRAQLERTRTERMEFSRRLAELEGKMQRVRNEIVHLQTEPRCGLSRVEAAGRKSKQ